MRLIKQTVNFDDPKTYHLYFGDAQGNPGTIITFFPWPNGSKGKIGDGQVGVTSYAVPSGALHFWEDRLKQCGITVKVIERFGEKSLQFDDPHGLKLEIVEHVDGKLNDYSYGKISSDVAIKGLAGATLYSAQPDKTANLLEKVMGFELIGGENEFIRFQSEAGIGNTIDVKTTLTGTGDMGVGTVHHIALRVDDDQDQLAWKNIIEQHDFIVTPVKDRNYFKSIYFREHGKILFEIATDPPGFAHDETMETMGQKLMLPKQYEQQREQIEQKLIPITVRNIDEL